MIRTCHEASTCMRSQYILYMWSTCDKPVIHRYAYAITNLYKVSSAGKHDLKLAGDSARGRKGRAKAHPRISNTRTCLLMCAGHKQ